MMRDDFEAVFESATSLLKAHFAERFDRPVEFFLIALDADDYRTAIVGDDAYQIGAQAAAWLQHVEPELRKMTRRN
jgi:hypothetical protein